MSRGNVLEGLQIRLEGKGKERATLHCCHQISGTNNWELASGEQAFKAFLLKNYLVEPPVNLCRGNGSQDGTSHREETL